MVVGDAVNCAGLFRPVLELKSDGIIGLIVGFGYPGVVGDTTGVSLGLLRTIDTGVLCPESLDRGEVARLLLFLGR